MTRELKQIEVYWDSQDPANEGWAERLTYDDGHQESGPCDELDHDDATSGELQDAVVALAWANGIEIDTAAVAADSRQDGGYAVWQR